MSILAACSCGSTFKVRDALAGKRVKCPACGHPLTVPDPNSDTANRIRATCDCGKKLRVKRELAGKRVKCPECGNPLAIPQASSDGGQGSDPVGLADTGRDPFGSSETPVATPWSSSSADLLGNSAFPTELLDTAPLPAPAPKSVCPNCSAHMSAEAVLCVACGYHRSKGHQVTAIVEEEPAAQSPAWNLNVERWSKYLIPAAAAATVLGFLALVGLIVPAFGYFLVLMLLIIGGFGSIAGYWWLLLIAWDEDVFLALLMFFVPPYSLYYMVTRWQHAVPFWLYAISIVANCVLIVYGTLLELLWV